MNVPVSQVTESSMILNCPSCAARLKLTKPPSPEKKQITCPRCGQAIPLPVAETPLAPPKSASVPRAAPAARKQAPAPRERPDREPDDREESMAAPRLRKKAKAK